MPHLKYLFHCGRQKRDNTRAVKMLHQMSVWVVAVALGLVLNSLRLQNACSIADTNITYPERIKNVRELIWVILRGQNYPIMGSLAINSQPPSPCKHMPH